MTHRDAVLHRIHLRRYRARRGELLQQAKRLRVRLNNARIVYEQQLNDGRKKANKEVVQALQAQRLHTLHELVQLRQVHAGTLRQENQIAIGREQHEALQSYYQEREEARIHEPF